MLSLGIPIRFSLRGTLMDTLRTRLLRIAVTLVACVGVAEAALVLVRPAEMLEHWRQLTGAALESSSTSVYRFEASAPGMLEVYLSAGLSVLSLSLATLLAWRAAHRPEARVLSVFLASLFVPGVLLSWAGVSVQAQGVIHAGLTWVAGACFLRFATLFPHPVTPALLLRAREIRA